MPIQPISGEIKSQPLNDNFAALDSEKLSKSGGTMSGDLAFTNFRGLVVKEGDVSTGIDLADFPDLVNAQGVCRFFRDTNTSESLSIVIYSGNGTANVDFEMIDGEITRINGTIMKITAGSSGPEGVVTATPGSLYLRTNGQMYLKTSGTGNTGWTAK